MPIWSLGAVRSTVLVVVIVVVVDSSSSCSGSVVVVIVIIFVVISSSASGVVVVVVIVIVVVVVSIVGGSGSGGRRARGFELAPRCIAVATTAIEEHVSSRAHDAASIRLRDRAVVEVVPLARVAVLGKGSVMASTERAEMILPIHHTDERANARNERPGKAGKAAG